MAAKLREHQFEHYNRIAEIVKTYHAYSDNSSTGSGKTYIGCNLARDLNMDILVVGPVTVLDHWGNVAREFGVNILGTMSFALMRGTSKYGVNHKFLTREKKKYTITPYFQECLKNRKVLLIFDEVHNLKNLKTIQREAALTLIREIVKIDNGSKIGLLSATPFDKTELCESFILLLGLTTRKQLYLYNSRTRVHVETGIKQVRTLCQSLDPVKTEELEEMRANPRSYPYELWSHILKYRLTSSMPPPPIPYEQDVKNGFYVLSPESVTQINQSQRKLFSSIRKDDDGNFIRDDRFRAAITTYITEVEAAKLEALIRISKQTLTKDPQSKVIIYVWRRKSVEVLVDALKEFNSFALNGEVDKRYRPVIIEKFQRPTKDIRVLVSHPSVGGVGISLDDRDGNWPRYMYIIPNYNCIDLIQALGRIYRTDTKSKATSRFFYSLYNKNETSILNSLARKAKVIEGSLNLNKNVSYFNGQASWYEVSENSVTEGVNSLNLDNSISLSA